MLHLTRSGAADDVVGIDEQHLGELPRELGVEVRLWKQLDETAFDNPRLGPEQVPELAREVAQLRSRYVEHHHEALARQHGVRARDPEVRRRLLEQLFAASPPPLIGVLDQLLALCERAVAAGEGLLGHSD